MANTSAPFCLGFAFRKGDIPSTQGVVASLANTQVTIKNRWDDGSAKFAVVAGRALLGASQNLTVTLSSGAAAAGTALTLADLKATNVSASIGCGSFGTASWSGTAWDTPFVSWISGPQMSSWIYRKPVGTDAHLVAWLEVRLYAGGQVEILPWIENGFLLVAGPTSKSATYTFLLGTTTAGTTQRVSVAINLPHHCRTPLISGTALSYWLGADPLVSVRHDTAYLQASELVPTYRASVSPTAGVVVGNSGEVALATSYTPLQIGNFTFDGDSMASTGYQQPIGLLPQHDVLYLTSTAPQTYGAVVRNGFSAGRYPIHYRDETTHRPLRFSSYPGLGIGDGQGFKDNGSSSSYTPPVGGTAFPPGWDCAHSPSVGFMAYLVTGRWYFMEEVQFAATCNHLGKGSVADLRDGAKGLVKTAVDAWQTRSCAWHLRTLAQACVATPDDDTALRNEFIAAMQYNADDLYATYVAQANNPFGFIQSGTTAYGGGIAVLAPWQQDFFTAAVGYALAMSPPVAAAQLSKWQSFFAWTARSVVGRLGPTDGSGFPFVSAAVYVLRVSSVNGPDYLSGAGPWYPNWATVWANEPAALTSASSPTGWLASTGNTLAGEIMPGERSLWGNLMPAVSYAVRFGVPGALAGYNRLVNASNWPTLRDSFNNAPVWSVTPAVFP